MEGNYLLLCTIRDILTKRLLITPVRRQAGSLLVDPQRIPLLRTEEPTIILLWTRLPIRILLPGLTPKCIMHRPLVVTSVLILLPGRASEPCTRTWAEVLHRKPVTLVCPVLSLLGALKVTQVPLVLSRTRIHPPHTLWCLDRWHGLRLLLKSMFLLNGTFNYPKDLRTHLLVFGINWPELALLTWNTKLFLRRCVKRQPHKVACILLTRNVFAGSGVKWISIPSLATTHSIHEHPRW